MKLYVGTYRKYNSGSLDGQWVDLDDFVDKYDFMAYCHELHDDEDDPEFMFQDYEADVDGEGDMWYNESYISEKYWEFADICEDNGFNKDIAYLYLNYIGSDDPHDLDNVGWACYSSYEEYITEIHDIPDWLLPYIDFEAMAKDSDETMIEYNDNIYIFFE